jgi:hypothetical protein
MTRSIKHSHPLANLANAVEEHVAGTWPELARAAPTDVWFTGSHVWHLLYPSPPQRDLPEIRDWDIFTIGEGPAQWIVKTLEWNRTPSCRTSDKWGAAPRIIDVLHVPTVPTLQTIRPNGNVSGYGDGYSYQTDRGIVDLWITALDSPLAELKAYPTISHAHCRAAWSFADGLIVLPNECARLRPSGDLKS